MANKCALYLKALHGTWIENIAVGSLIFTRLTTHVTSCRLCFIEAVIEPDDTSAELVDFVTLLAAANKKLSSRL